MFALNSRRFGTLVGTIPVVDDGAVADDAAKLAVPMSWCSIVVQPM